MAVLGLLAVLGTLKHVGAAVVMGKSMAWLPRLPSMCGWGWRRPQVHQGFLPSRVHQGLLPSRVHTKRGKWFFGSGRGKRGAGGGGEGTARNPGAQPVRAGPHHGVKHSSTPNPPLPAPAQVCTALTGRAG
jgi:hypothetical protein